MAEELEKKIARHKEKKKIRRQQERLNNLSEWRWRRIGSFAAWVGYSVNIEGEQEVVPVRKNTSKFELSTVISNLKRYIRRHKELEAQAKKKQEVKSKRR